MSSSEDNGSKLEQSVDRVQHHPIAPTLPTHSQFLTDDSNTYLFSKAKLSARYINNANRSSNSTSSNLNEYYSKTATEKCLISQPTTSSSSSSKLLHYYEKSCPDTSEHLEKTKKSSVNPVSGKRLVPTRNAATSPHLDFRKLDSLTKLRPSPKKITSEKLNFTNKKKDKIDEVAKTAKPLENNYSLREKKSFKQLKSTRSLSPKPPVFHQNNLLNSHLSSFDSKNLKTFNTSIKSKQQLNKVCRSEQSSPNVMDGSEIKFTYKELKNRSTSCLGGNAYFDPWLKASGSNNVSTLSVNVEEENATAIKENNSKDPWVKRVDVKLETERNNLFRQTKSFSISKFDVKSNAYLPNYSKSPAFLNEEVKSSSVTNVKDKLQSAPSSPLFLTATDNYFSSSSNYLNNQFNMIEKTHERSASFSPARVKDGHNPFNNNMIQVNLPNSPPTSSSVGSEVVHELNFNKIKLNFTSANNESLNVFNPNLLTARHSFSSVSEQNKSNELQLNIRRLSDQMRQKESVIANHPTKMYSSNRNAEEKKKEARKQVIYNKTNTKAKEIPNRADFSEYLEQFRCSEVKKAANIEKDNAKESNSTNTDTKNVQLLIKNKSLQSADCPLETTC